DVEQVTIVATDSDGANLEARQSSSEKLIGAAPSWSPDGTMTAFYRKRAPGLGDTTTVAIARSLDTGEERVYSHPGIMSIPAHWLHDSKAFLVTIENEGGAHALYRVDVKSGEFKQIFSVGMSQTYNLWEARLGPDDNTLYLPTSDGKSLLALDLSTSQVQSVF